MKTFKILALTFLCATFSLESLAQDTNVKNKETTSTYKAHAEGWLVDLNEAYAESERTGKPILANFTGSDWCGWCIKLKREVFDQEGFKTWAKENVVLLELDFPRKKQIPEKIKQQNRSLQQAFKVSGYPTIWVFNLEKDAQGQFQIEALGKTGYVAGGPSAFTKGVDQIIATNVTK